MVELSRRRFLSFAPLIVAAPAIVRASSLMKIHALPEGWTEIKVVPGAAYSGLPLRHIRDLLFPGLRDLIVRYDQIPNQWPDYFEREAA